jgi:hypothetical protein
VDIGNRTPAELLDLLVTNNIRCFNAQDKINDSSLSSEEQLLAAKEAQKLNNRRNQLIRKIDELLGFGEFTQLEKSYKDKYGA